jgi:hypothetical protein
MRYTVHKNLVKIAVFGDDDIWATNSNSVYRVDTSLNNCKRMRFNFNGCLNSVKLSKNARLILESLFIPTITNLINYINIRVVTSTEDTNLDSGKLNTGNPILITTRANTMVYNNSELLYNINVPSTFLSQGFIEIELESPIVTAAVDFTTSGSLRPFYMTFVIIDQDEEETKDPDIAQTIDYKNYGRLGMPIRTPLT